MESDKKMFALIKQEEKVGYNYTKIDIPVPQEGEVLVRVDKASICGSDINLYKWNDIAKKIAQLPFIPGHEMTGTVIQIGQGCSRINVGDRVCCENHYYCGKCYQCKNGMPEICSNMGQYGHGKQTMHGGLCQYSIIPEKYVYKLQYNIDTNSACLLEPLGVAHNALERIDVKGQDLLIIGAGAIGLCAIGIGRALGAKKIIICDMFDQKLKRAKQMGADIIINVKNEDLYQIIMRETENFGIARIAECSGAPDMVNNQFKLLSKGGQVVLVGLPKAPFHIEEPMADLVFKGLTVKGMHGRLIFHTWEQCEKLIHEKKIDLTPIVSHEFPLSSHDKIFDILLSGEGCKIIINPQLNEEKSKL